MNDSEFNDLTDAVLRQIEAGLEASGADLDFETPTGGVLEIEFADRSKIIRTGMRRPEKSGSLPARAVFIIAGMVRSGGIVAMAASCWRCCQNWSVCKPARPLICAAPAELRHGVNLPAWQFHPVAAPVEPLLEHSRRKTALWPAPCRARGRRVRPVLRAA